MMDKDRLNMQRIESGLTTGQLAHFRKLPREDDTTGSLSDSPRETGHVNEIRRVMYPGQAKQIQI